MRAVTLIVCFFWSPNVEEHVVEQGVLVVTVLARKHLNRLIVVVNVVHFEDLRYVQGLHENTDGFSQVRRLRVIRLAFELTIRRVRVCSPRFGACACMCQFLRWACHSCKVLFEQLPNRRF